MTDCNLANTPIQSKLNLDKSNMCDNNLNTFSETVLTRPDIAYAVSYLSQINNCYSQLQWNYAKRILNKLRVIS